eukprot:gene10148-7105_t
MLHNRIFNIEALKLQLPWPPPPLDNHSQLSSLSYLLLLKKATSVYTAHQFTSVIYISSLTFSTSLGNRLF